jgi:hypothetical protein
MKFALLSLLLLAPLICNAQSGFRGGDMLRYCEQAERAISAPSGTPSSANLDEANLCLGFIAGVNAGVQIESAVRGEIAPTFFCIPRAVNAEQQMRVVIQWLRANPAKHHEPAAILLGFAFRDAFPCK